MNPLLDEFWTKYTRADVEQAIDFYDRSPDGQYDTLAAEGLTLLLFYFAEKE